MASCGRKSWGVTDGVYFVCKFSEILSVLTLLIIALFYCTVFGVLLWMWQSVCSSYCRQRNAVSFNTDTSCCNVQIHIQSVTWPSLGTLQGFLGAFAKFRSVTISFIIYDDTSVHYNLTRISGIIHDDLSTFMSISHTAFPRFRNISNKICSETKTHILYKIFFLIVLFVR